MSALLFLQEKRKAGERIEFVSTLRLAMNGEAKSVEKVMQRWAKSAEIDLTFEE